MSKASEHQPAPTGDGPIVLNMVLSDLLERAEAGRKKYGCYLRAGNGRDPLWDAYQEGIDMVLYLRQLIHEREQNGRADVG